MKRFVVPFILLATFLALAKIGFALTGSSVQPSEKQLLVDGDMEFVAATSTSGGAWAPSQAFLSKQTASPHGGNRVLRVAWDGVAGHTQSTAYQGVITGGKKYRITGWARSDPGGVTVPLVIVGIGSYITPFTGVSSNVWQRIDAVFTAPAGDLYLMLYANNDGAAGRYTEFDDITLTEYKGYVQVQDSQNITDGDMETAGYTDWTGWNNPTLSKQTIAPHSGKQALRVAYNGTANPLVYQSIFSANTVYRCTGWARGDGLGTSIPRVYVGNNVTNWFLGTNSNAWQHFDITANTLTGNNLNLYNYSASGYVEWDDIYCTLYKGQSGVINKQVLSDGDAEMSGTANWSNGSSGATLTKQSTNPHSGNQVLRVAWAVGTYAYASNPGLLTPGLTYRITGWARSDGVVAPTVNIAGGQLVWAGTTATTWQKIDVTFKPLYTAVYLIFTATSASYVEYDDLYLTLAQ